MTSDLALFPLISLAALRLTHFITSDVLPDPIRDRIIQRWTSAGGDRYVEALTCYWCMGFWVSSALVAGLSFVVSIPLPGLYALAVSTVVGFGGEILSWMKH